MVYIYKYLYKQNVQINKILPTSTFLMTIHISKKSKILRKYMQYK